MIIIKGLRERGKKLDFNEKVLDCQEYFANFLRPSRRTARKCSRTEAVLY